jgi:hypothetical protein
VFLTSRIPVCRDFAGTTKVVIAAFAVALDVAVESWPSVGVCIEDCVSGGLSELQPPASTSTVLPDWHRDLLVYPATIAPLMYLKQMLSVT